MSLAALLENENELTHNIGAQQPIVLSTRIRLARNLTRYPFPGRAKGEQRRELAQRIDATQFAGGGMRPRTRGRHLIADADRVELGSDDGDVAGRHLERMGHATPCSRDLDHQGWLG